MNREIIAIKAGSNIKSFLCGQVPQGYIGISLQADGVKVHRQGEQGLGEVFVQGDEGDIYPEWW